MKTTRKTTRKSANQEPLPTGKPSKPSPASFDAEVSCDLVRQLLLLLQPALDFHQPVDGATANDLRIFWDVRIVRGGDAPFARVTGSSSMAGVFAPRMLACATGRLQREVDERIIVPLASVMQGELERLGFEGDDGGKKADVPGSGAAGDPCEEGGD